MCRVRTQLRTVSRPTSRNFWLSWYAANSINEDEAAFLELPIGTTLERRKIVGGLVFSSKTLYQFVVHVEIACMELLSDRMLVIQGNNNVKAVFEAILKSNPIRRSFQRTIVDVEALAANSGRAIDESEISHMLRFLL